MRKENERPLRVFLLLPLLLLLLLLLLVPISSHILDVVVRGVDRDITTETHRDITTERKSDRARSNANLSLPSSENIVTRQNRKNRCTGEGGGKTRKRESERATREQENKSERG